MYASQARGEEVASQAYVDTEKSEPLIETYSSEDGASGPRVKKMPGETRDEAAERVRKQKELRRLQNLVRYAYPRQREAYLYKKKLLPPEAFNCSVDLLKLKKESMRIDQQQYL